MTSRGRRLLVPGITVAVMLAVLLGLGTWQIFRLRWKEAILARIADAERAAPVALGRDPLPYTKVAVSGRFRFDLAAQYGADVRDTSSGPVMGSYQVVPLQREGAPAILVDRGWVPKLREIALNNPTGLVTVAGYIHPDEKSHWFSPTDDLATRQFYTLNTATIGTAVGLNSWMPFTLIALGSPDAGSYPVPAQHLPRPPNDHLVYAITWYGLAVTLVIVFLVWTRRPATDDDRGWQ